MCWHRSYDLPFWWASVGAQPLSQGHSGLWVSSPSCPGPVGVLGCLWGAPRPPGFHPVEGHKCDSRAQGTAGGAWREASGALAHTDHSRTGLAAPPEHSLQAREREKQDVFREKYSHCLLSIYCIVCIFCMYCSTICNFKHAKLYHKSADWSVQCSHKLKYSR